MYRFLYLCFVSSVLAKPRHWLGRATPKWPMWCRVRCKILTQSIKVTVLCHTPNSMSKLAMINVICDVINKPVTGMCLLSDAVMRRYSWVICDDTLRHMTYRSGLLAVSAITRLTLSVISRCIRLANMLWAPCRLRGLSLGPHMVVAVLSSVMSAITALATHRIWSAMPNWDTALTHLHMSAPVLLLLSAAALHSTPSPALLWFVSC